jgi:hypothetical protein
MPKKVRASLPNPKPFNPLEKKHLGESIADALLERPVSPLPPAERFSGSGVYALYYTGNYKHYSPIAKANSQSEFRIPIYVGKATPKGGRKGGFLSETPSGSELYSRLRIHSVSIGHASNLNLKDFSCRYLIVDDIWIPLGEALLISRFKPLWNHVVEGFGINAPGKGRLAQQLSPWDTLHSGRPSVRGLTGEKRREEDIEKLIRAHFEENIIK